MKNSINFNLVADIYDYYVNVDFDIPFYLNETKDFNEEILELMCGTGRVSIPLLKTGKKMNCVDYSICMLDVFKRKISNENYNPQILKMDLLELKFQKKFGMILLPFHSLSEIIDKENQYKAVKKVSEYLKDDGLFICALQNPVVKLKYADGVKRKIGEFKLDDNEKLVITSMNKFNYESGMVSGYQFYEIYDCNNLIKETRRLEINFRPISNLEFHDMVNCAGLKIINTFGDYSYSEFFEETSNYMIYKIIK